MTVDDLIAELMKLPKDQAVFIASDPEGNSFHALADVDELHTDEDGDPCHEDDAEDECDMVVVLWP